jgi:hypothetical protein
MATTQDFRLPASDSLEDVESAVQTVHGSRGYDLRIHASALDKRLGALRDAAFLQVLLTWARLSPNASINLLSNGSEDTDGVLQEACGYATGIASIVVAGGVKVRGEPVLKSKALVTAFPRISAAHEGRYDSLVKGRTVDLLCVSGAERQYLKPLFSAPSADALRDKFDLRATVRALAMRAAQCRPEDLDEDTVSALATLTHELFENTQEHAVKSVAGIPYRRHVELLSASWVSLDGEAERQDLAVSSRLIDYWRSLENVQRLRRRPAGICFSFLDSGPGMAARLSGKDYPELTLEEEREALHECLRMHVTSKSDKGTGGGFEAVLTQIAQAGGFVRVRSGRHSIFKCFLPGEPAGDVTQGFEDWFAGRQLYRVAGTLISVFIPFPRART